MITEGRMSDRVRAMTDGELAELQNRLLHSVQRGDGLLEVLIRVPGNLPDPTLEALADSLGQHIPLVGALVTFQYRPLVGDVLTGRTVVVADPWA